MCIRDRSNHNYILIGGNTIELNFNDTCITVVYKDIETASARRVLQLLDEKEEVEEISGKEPAYSGDIKVKDLSFSYEQEEVLRKVQASFKKGQITGIHGKSGSGKSTLLKLLMRFWNAPQGSISINGVSLEEINTCDLRNMQSLVTQETVLFHDTIFNNIRIAKPVSYTHLGIPPMVKWLTAPVNAVKVIINTLVPTAVFNS